VNIPITIQSRLGPKLAFNILESNNSISVGNSIDAPGGVSVTLKSMAGFKAIDIPSVLEFVAETALNLDLGLFSAWLYDKFKNTDIENIKIGDKTAEVSIEDIETKLSQALKELDEKI